jgi:hypothetical protein
MRGGIFRVTGTLGAHLQAGSDAVPSGIPDAQTQHGRLKQNRLHASLPARTIAPSASVPASLVRARTVPCVSTKSTGVAV